MKSILKEETYIGHSVHNKQTNISFKNKKKVRKPKEEWYRVENTHEAIISEDVFRQVQEQICNRRRRQKNGTTQIFSGLVKCADCGWSLAYGMNSQNKIPMPTTIVASTGKDCTSVPCTISAMMCFTPMSFPVCNTGLCWHSRIGTNF